MSQETAEAKQIREALELDKQGVLAEKTEEIQSASKPSACRPHPNFKYIPLCVAKSLPFLAACTLILTRLVSSCLIYNTQVIMRSHDGRFYRTQMPPCSPG